MSIKDQFEQAVTENKQLSQKTSKDILLQLYSFYKKATEGDGKTEAPPNMFDFVNKAKHDAWSSLRGKSPDDAMQEYISLVNKLKG